MSPRNGQRCCHSPFFENEELLTTGIINHFHYSKHFPDSSVGKESDCNARDPSWIPGLGRSPGEGKGYPLQYSGLENSMDYSPMGSQRVRHDYLLIIITNDTSNSYHLGSYYCDLSTLFVLSHGKGLTPFSDKVTEAPVLRPPDAKN